MPRGLIVCRLKISKPCTLEARHRKRRQELGPRSAPSSRNCHPDAFLNRASRRSPYSNARALRAVASGINPCGSSPQPAAVKDRYQTRDGFFTDFPNRSKDRFVSPSVPLLSTRGSVWFDPLLARSNLERPSRPAWGLATLRVN